MGSNLHFLWLPSALGLSFQQLSPKGRRFFKKKNPCTVSIASPFDWCGNWGFQQSQITWSYALTWVPRRTGAMTKPMAEPLKAILRTSLGIQVPCFFSSSYLFASFQWAWALQFYIKLASHASLYYQCQPQHWLAPGRHTHAPLNWRMKRKLKVLKSKGKGRSHWRLWIKVTPLHDRNDTWKCVRSLL